MTEEIPTKVVVCCADHDHAVDPACEINAESVIVPLTPDEIAANKAAAEQAAADQAVRVAEAAELAATKESANAKLKALGLSDAEIAALSK